MQCWRPGDQIGTWLCHCFINPFIIAPELDERIPCSSQAWVVMAPRTSNLRRFKHCYDLFENHYAAAVLPLPTMSLFWHPGTACLKWKKRFLAGGFPIFLGRWSDQTFFESSIKTKTENICSCWIFVKTKDLSKIFVKNVPSEVWIGYKTQFLKKIWWCLPQGADSFSLL